MASMLNEALRWREQGITPIPCRYRSKQPVVKWKQWSTIVPPLALVHRWFVGLQNLAIIIGNDLTVLDFDISVHYHNWRIAHPSLSATYTVKSCRGYHVYFRVAARNETANMLGGEILAAGHMITVPPSVHQSGHVYMAIGNHPILSVSSLDEIGIVPMARERIGVVSGETEQIEPRVWLPTGNENFNEGELPIGKIKANVSIASLLARMGVQAATGNKSFVMCCPFHEDNNPSFQVWTDTNKAYCHAAGCRAHRSMDVIDLAALYWNVSNKTAIGMLANF